MRSRLLRLVAAATVAGVPFTLGACGAVQCDDVAGDTSTASVSVLADDCGEDDD